MNSLIKAGILAVVILMICLVQTAAGSGDNVSGDNSSLNETAENESSGRMSGEFLSTFDSWVTPTDMSQYNPDIVISTPKRPDEEMLKDNPGMILLDPEREEEFMKAGEITDYGNGTVIVIFHHGSGLAECVSSGKFPADSGENTSGSKSSPSFTFLSGIAVILSSICIMIYLGKRESMK